VPACHGRGSLATSFASDRFDVAAFIDDRKVGRRELTLLLVVAAVLFIDGFDMFFFGKILPAIADGLDVPPAAMRDVVFWTYVGMAVGAFVMPPIADRIGRRPILALCAFMFGVLSFVAAWSETVFQMAVLRGLAGIFFSAMLPIGLALLSEMTPRRHRATFMAVALVGFSAGNASSGAVAAWLLDIYGWQVGFWLAGLLGFIALPLLMLIPESLPLRVTRDRKDPKIPATIRWLDPAVQLRGDEHYHLAGVERSETDKDRGPLALLQRPYLIQTLILWPACFLAMGNIALLANWMPTFFQELGGVPIQLFAISAMIAFAGGAAGTLTMGWLLDRTNPYWLVALFFLVNAGALYALGQLQFGTGVFLAALILWNYTQVGGQTGINTLAALGYPPEMRSSGLGWAGGWGRIAGIVIPAWAGAKALEMMLPLETVMGLIAFPAIVVAVLIIVLGISNGGKIGVRQMQPEPEGEAGTVPV